MPDACVPESVGDAVILPWENDAVCPAKVGALVKLPTEVVAACPVSAAEVALDGVNVPVLVVDV